MKLTLNPYALVIERAGTTNFMFADAEHPVTIVLNEAQAEVLAQLHDQRFFDYGELCGVFDEPFVNTLVQNGCLVPAALDTVSCQSRTNAFFATHQMPEARNRLSQAKVLILGAGGIGTHMAWHMVALGVAKLTVVDFDTVEESNFNRQLLFDRGDLGKVKVEALRDKLSAINPAVQIETLCTRISSQEQLEEICLADDYQLIIKALDSPAEFPVWLDRVAKAHRLTYISGITLRERVLIGPSYLPGDGDCGWSDLMKLDYTNAKKVYGTAPSLGVMLYHVSDELAAEAFKILTGYGTLKYRGKILSKNIFTNEEQVIGKEEPKNSAGEGGKSLLMELLLMITVAAAGVSQPWFIPVGAVLSLILPFVLYKTRRERMRATFLNATVFSAGVLLAMLQRMDLSSVTAVISFVVLLFGVHSATTLLVCSLNFVASQISEKRKSHQLPNRRYH